ncbi:MAG: methyltransferase domain-containing protein [Thermodesulfobacteriota bacterium]
MYGNLMMYFLPGEELTFQDLGRCPVCDADLAQAPRIDTEAIYLHDLAPGSEVALCGGCGVVLQKKRLAECEWERYNDAFPSEGSVRWDQNPQRFDPELQAVRTHCPAGAAVLDVGCGFGEFAMILKEAGYAAEGIDIRSGALQYGREQFGLRLHAAFYNEEAARRLGERFDALVSIHAFEHFHDPRATLRAMHINLKEKGLVFLTVPDGEPLDPSIDIMPFDFYTSGHPFYYDARVLGHILRTGGFEVVFIEKGFDAVSERPVLRAAGRKNGGSTACLPLSGNGPSAAEITRFQEAFILRREKEILRNLAFPRPMRVAVYGAWLYGLLTVRALERNGHCVAAVVDSDKGKWGHMLAGHPIQSPDTISKDPSVEAAVITSIGGYESIKNQIHRHLGLDALPLLSIAGGIIRKRHAG